MNQDLNFKLIDIDHWARKSYFEHYLKKVKCTYSMTLLVNIEALLIACHKYEIKLYPAMIYILSTAVNQIEELRIDYDVQGRLGIWDYRLPSHTIFHEYDKTFSTIWTPYDSSFIELGCFKLEA